MPVCVLGLDVIVVVLPVTSARVVRRVDIYAVHLSAADEGQRLEDVVVLAVDDGVEGLIPAMLDDACRAKAGVERVAELDDNSQILQRSGPPILDRKRVV